MMQERNTEGPQEQEGLNGLPQGISKALTSLLLGDRVELGGVVYEFSAIDRAAGLFELSIDGSPLTKTHFDQFPAPLRAYMLNEAAREGLIKQIEQHMGRAVPPTYQEAYAQAWALLHSEGNAFFKACVGLVSDYHALDTALMQIMFLGMTRARYSDVDALLHIDCTGGSGAGKNDLVHHVMACVPVDYKDLYSTMTPTALQYHTLEVVKDAAGKVVGKKTNPNRYRGKIVSITEVADAAGFAALKALAETDETAEFTHSATVNGEAIDMTITGPRCVFITSVEGVKDTQVKRRFVHASVSDDTLENQLEKLAIAEAIFTERKEINTDRRVEVVRAGLDLVFNVEGEGVEPQRIEAEAEAVMKHLDRMFMAAGYGMTNIKQFQTLCNCSALWKRFKRGYWRIEVDDVCEAWHLLSTFERETITKTTRHGIATLHTIKQLSDDYEAAALEEGERAKAGAGKLIPSEQERAFNEAYEGALKRPTKGAIAKASNVPQATVYRLLKTASRNDDSLGELLELGYVRNDYDGKQTVLELTTLGASVLADVSREINVNGKVYTPIEPLKVPDAVTLTNRQLMGLDAVGRRQQQEQEQPTISPDVKACLVSVLSDLRAASVTGVYIKDVANLKRVVCATALERLTKAGNGFALEEVEAGYDLLNASDNNVKDAIKCVSDNGGE